MIQFIKQKAIKLLVLITLVTTFSFLLVKQSPIDPVNAYIGADMMLISAEQKEIITQKWGLDLPMHQQFAKWLGSMVTGDMGNSMIYKEPVSSVIFKRFKKSFLLMTVAWTLSGVLGFFLGIISGVFKGKFVDKVISVYCYTLASTPTFWLGIVLLSFFVQQLGWAPFTGSTPPGISAGDATIWDKMQHLFLPALTLSIVGIASITLHTREKVISLMQSDMVLYAKANGENHWSIIVHHLLRNALLPAITLQFASIGEIFGGSAFVEYVFSYQGLGKAVVDAGIRGDVPLLLGIVIFSALFIFMGNTIADLLYVKIDPRIKLGDLSYEQ
jgi:peptide/nickel transport system permease protein